ncbi:MAG: hypothetical protein EZS28_001664 [Streblomastix strix]|uniref:Uncharacterized protein n=1 Tax=Streblomastix strix TaxID=222440 RepID=A0A5J4X8F8_9EUKA|nr:MAG: hypothetical protein EZS28_001664 [Streblomastix strix]
MAARRDKKNRTREEIENNIKTWNIEMQLRAEEGKYIEAGELDKKIEQEKIDLIEWRRNDIISKQKIQLDDLRTAYEFLKQRFEELWDAEQEKFENDAEKQRLAMQKRQQKEFADLEEQLRKEEGLLPKFSTEVASLRKSERSLAQQKKFQEAYKAKISADLLEKQELERFRLDEEARHKSLKLQMQQQQSQEYQGLLKRLDREKRELAAQRKNDAQKIEFRNSNVFRDLKNQHKTEINKFERELTTQGDQQIKISEKQVGQSLNQTGSVSLSQTNSATQSATITSSRTPRKNGKK